MTGMIQSTELHELRSGCDPPPGPPAGLDRGALRGGIRFSMDGHTTAEVAALFGVSAERVRFLARQRGVGTKTREGWRFTAAEVEALRPADRPGPVAMTTRHLQQRNEL
jgi:hypothetical protein